MARPVHHPSLEQISLSAVLEALSDPVRQRIVARLAERAEECCSSFGDLGSKANLTYHFARLREAGVTRVRPAGTYRYLSLRVEDLEALFPGLLEAVVAGVRRGRGPRRPPRSARAPGAAPEAPSPRRDTALPRGRPALPARLGMTLGRPLTSARARPRRRGSGR